MASHPFAFLALLLATLFAAPQDDKFPDPIVQRATKVDDQGLRQWVQPADLVACPQCKNNKETECFHCKDFEADEQPSKCPECGGKKKAPCRVCAGGGSLPDPLEKAPCPGCFGASVVLCIGCRGRGAFPVQGGGKKWQKCTQCKAIGGWPCLVCKGARTIAPPKLKPNLANAPSSELVPAKDAVMAVQAALERFRFSGHIDRVRNEVKAYGEAWKPAVKWLAAAKDAPAMLKEIMDGMGKGDVWVGQDERKAEAAKRFLLFNVYYLKHQAKILDLCLERAQANEKAAAGK
jgi:hypothetical protein